LGVSIDEPLSLAQPLGAIMTAAASARFMPCLNACHPATGAVGNDELIKKDTN